MAKPNFAFEKRQKEIAKKQKKIEKQQQKTDSKNIRPEEDLKMPTPPEPVK